MLVSSSFAGAGDVPSWTNASSEVKRSVFMDDIVYSISASRIKANNLQTLTTDVAEVSIR